MGLLRAHRSRRRQRIDGGPRLEVENLEVRIVLAAGIGYDRASRRLTIVGSTGDDSAEVRRQGANFVASLNTAAGRSTLTVRGAAVSRISFTGFAGDDTFTNLTTVASRADGGTGDDVLRGGSAADQLIGGDGNDQLFGEGGNDTIDGGAANDLVRGGGGNDRLMGDIGQDALHGDHGIDSIWGGIDDDWIDGGRGNDSVFGEEGADVLHGGGDNDVLAGGAGTDELLGGAGADSLDGGEGDDRLDGELGTDQLVGGGGLDSEVDSEDRFADGDVDGDGFDDDHDAWDIFYENGNPSAYADDATVATTIQSVSASVREALGIASDDAGLRVRVSKQQFGDLVTGVWRYLTPDKIQVWARWCYPAADSTQLKTFVQYQYKGPYSGNSADYTNPANYAVSQENRLYAGYLSGPITFVSWLPGNPVGFFYTAPNAQATGYPAPIEPLKVALGGLPNFSHVGDSFQGTLSRDPGFEGVQPILGLLRTINQVNQTWYADLRAEPIPGLTTTPSPRSPS